MTKLIEAADEMAEAVWQQRNLPTTVLDHVRASSRVQRALTAYQTARESAGEVNADGLKPLVWYESPDDDTDFCANAIGLTYVVACDLDGFCSWGFFRHIWREEGSDKWDIDDAKAAAQADYETRIRSALAE